MVELNKAFFGKNNCLKVNFNIEKKCYLHWGIKGTGGYEWLKAKFNCEELALIKRVLDGQNPSESFIHSFEGKKTQFWLSQKESVFFFRAKSENHDISKSLNIAEACAFSILIAKMIPDMCEGKVVSAG